MQFIGYILFLAEIYSCSLAGGRDINLTPLHVARFY